MPLIREFQIQDGVLVFDSHLDKSFSTYEAHHLEALALAEETHFWFQRRRDKICETFQRYVPKAAKILEIGGGTGFVAAKLNELGFSIEMADIHSNGLRHAQKKSISRLFQFDLFHPPFAEEFDVVCLFDVLEHLRDPLKALKCLKSMLKPNGMIILTVPAHQWLWSREDCVAGHERRFTKQTLKELFFASGFQPVHMRYFFSAILPFLLLRRWIKRDDRSPLKPDEIFEPKMHPLFNRLFDLATRTEFYLDRFLPNFAGGSLLAVVKLSDKIQ